MEFLEFYPGLVGGHCIGVDPYYLTYQAEKLGYHSQIILSGRRINDGMGKYIAENVVKRLIKADKQVHDARVAILGFAFKEDCPDTRNTKVMDIVRELREYGIEPFVSDPVVDVTEAEQAYDIAFSQLSELLKMDAVVLAVAHKAFRNFTMEQIDRFFQKKEKRILLDIKGIFDREDFEAAGYDYWRL